MGKSRAQRKQSRAGESSEKAKPPDKPSSSPAPHPAWGFIMLGVGLVAQFAAKPSIVGAWVGTILIIAGLVWLGIAIMVRLPKRLHRVAVYVLLLSGAVGAIFFGRWATYPSPKHPVSASSNQGQNASINHALSPGQRWRLVEALRMSPTGDINIASIMTDRDSVEYAYQIRGVLAEAGWNTTSTGMWLAGTYPEGLALRVHSLRSVPPRATFLKQAFDSAGVACGWKEVPSIGKEEIQIMVGGKPSDIDISIPR